MFSRKLDLVKAAVEKFHFFKLMIAGRKVEDNIQAQRIPKLIESPYPVAGVMGDVSMVRKAAVVVMDVRNMGSSSRFRVRVMACCTFLCVRASRKNRDTICTPSELAIVKRTMAWSY